MSDTWDKLTAFVEAHRGELVLNYFEVVRLDGLGDIPDDDYYFRLSGKDGATLLSCVGRMFLLKGFLPDGDYNELERVFNLSIEQWIAGQESQYMPAEFSKLVDTHFDELFE